MNLLRYIGIIIYYLPLEHISNKNVVSGLATSLVVLMGHGISIDDSLVATMPNYTKEQSARATALARRLQQVIDDENSPPKDKGRA